MEVLPIRTILESDEPIFGSGIVNLAKLAQLDFPVALGVAITPPEMVLKTILEHYQYHQKEVFEQKLELIKSSLVKIPVPNILNDELKGYKSYFLNEGVVKNKKTLWLKLLEIWLSQIRAIIWHEGFSPQIVSKLKCQLVFFTKDKFTLLDGYFDPETKDTVVSAHLSPPQLKKIDELIISANKKLFLPQIYQFLLTDKFRIIKVMPYTHPMTTLDSTSLILPKADQKKIIKAAMKVYFEYQDKIVFLENLDGALISTNYEIDFDETVLRLLVACGHYPQLPILFKFPDEQDQEIRGSLRLIHQSKLLSKTIDAFLFCRNKKNLLNIQIVIPRVSSYHEFAQIQKALALKGVIRKGSVKLWLELAIIENLINLESYLVSGLDGVIIDLDELMQHITGQSGQDPATIIKFLTQPIKILHKMKILVLVKGKLLLHPDILDFLVDSGVWGVIVGNYIEVESLPEHLAWVEKRMIIKRFHL